MKDNDKSGSKKQLFLIVLVVFLLILIVFFLLRQTAGRKEFSKNTTSTNSSISTKTKLGLSTNWLTYTSKTYSIDYPDAWQLHTSSFIDQKTQTAFELNDNEEAILTFFEPNQPDHSGKPYGMTIILRKPQENPENLTIGDWLKKNFPPFSLVRKEKIAVGQIKGIAVRPLLGADSVYIFISDNSLVYQIVATSYTTKDYPAQNYENLYDYDEVLNQILSTFKFFSFQNP